VLLLAPCADAGRLLLPLSPADRISTVLQKGHTGLLTAQRAAWSSKLASGTDALQRSHVRHSMIFGFQFLKQ
jgi:hypothetical protein